MLILPNEPYKLVFSLYQHEYLGYLIEPYLVKLTPSGSLSFQWQNISASNVSDFKSGLTSNQIELVKLISKISHNKIFRKFKDKSTPKIGEFYKKVFAGEKGNTSLKDAIMAFIDNHKREVFKKIQKESLYIMSPDGVPTWKKVSIMPETARVYFHFIREEEETTYFPVIRYGDERVKFQFQKGRVINDLPAALLVDQKLYIFENHVDGKKISPFLNKSNIKIPRRIEETYYKKFIVPLVAGFNVYAKGFEIIYEKDDFESQLVITEIKNNEQTLLFDIDPTIHTSSKVKIELLFNYGGRKFRYNSFDSGAHVYLSKTEDSWKFHKIKKNKTAEQSVVKKLKKIGLDFKNGVIVLPRIEALNILNQQLDQLQAAEIEIIQGETNTQNYFLGHSQIEVKATEKNDWFDIEARVVFGEFEIPFKEIKHYILNQIKEFQLPNGEWAVIPEAWFTSYSELFELTEQDDQPLIKKYYIGLLNLLSEEGIISTSFKRKIEAFGDFKEISPIDLPKDFNGELRPYQKAGYDWLYFLKSYNFGGCLADDMGLGKTVTTLAFLQKIKEEGETFPSLLVLPTSLIYNWVNEINRFTPQMKIHIHYGPQRTQNMSDFEAADLVITSYGVLRIDIDFIKKLRFNYAILDESQSIKNPQSANFKAAMDLNTKNRLILTGTPLENSTMDLWSQMTFINPGLLENVTTFRKTYSSTGPENEALLTRLSSKIKPFILRRTKKQVAKDLPDKIETVVYSQMTDEQEELYEETKSVVRNQILGVGDAKKAPKSNIMILQGLSKLRQIANHPSMVKEDYTGDSGKAQDILSKIIEVVEEGSKTLVFSQFVKHLAFVSSELDRLKIPYLYLDGSTKNRMALVERFQQEDTEKIFLISLKAGGVGLNLTAAENVFILDPWWNPAIEAQAIDRAHRIGQTKTVFIYKFISQNTIEEKIVELQNSKRKLYEDLIIEENTFYKSLTQSDILNILE